MINPSRLATAAVLCELGIVVCIASAGSADLKKAPPPTLDRLAPLLTADIAPARPPRRPAQAAAPRLAAVGPAVTSVDIAKAAADIVKATDADIAAVPNALQPVVVAALSNPSDVLRSDIPPPAAATASTPGPVATSSLPDPTATSSATDPAVQVSSLDPAAVLPEGVATSTAPDAAARDARDDVSSVEIFDECFVADACIDRYLWALYKRTPKQDSVKEDEQRKVTVKRKGKMVSVTRTFSRVVDEDFAWKDTKAAEKTGQTMMDYVIGGMDRSFKIRLFNMLRAAEQAGLSPGITSAFRDDYRQSIASGLHAASDRSYHGGSSRGGYGHGLAADVVSTNGATRALRQASSEAFWKWIDTHGKEFGIGRPYLDRDPPHVGPIDGEEYAKHRGATTARATSTAKDRRAGRADAAAAKRAKLARS